MLDQIFNIPWPAIHQWGYWTILIIAAIEAVPLVGTVVPGQSVIIIGGFFSKLHVLNIGFVILFASIGAVAGDLAGYIIGKKYGYSFIERFGKYFFFKLKHLEKAKSLAQKNPGKLLIIGRFSPVTRALAPFVAGTSGIKFWTFLFFNTVGSVSWAAASVLIGYIFGASYEIVSKIIGRFIFLGILFIILAVLGYRFINKKEHIFEKYHLHTLGINLTFLIIFLRMADAVVETGGDWLIRMDESIHISIMLWWTKYDLLTKAMLAVDYATMPAILIAVSLALLLFLIYKKKWYHSILLSLSAVGGFIIEFVLKRIIERARPFPPLAEASDFSFPSAHAAMATIICLLVIYSFRDEIKSKARRWIMAIANILIIIVVAFSRIYLGVHWTTDTIAGISLGIFWITFLILIIRLSIYTLETGFITKIKDIIIKSAKRF